LLQILVIGSLNSCCFSFISPSSGNRRLYNRVVIGRKNFLFAITVRGAKASGVMYSLIETAKENKMNPYDYLVWVMKQAPGLDLKNNPEKAALLLPENFMKPAVI